MPIAIRLARVSDARQLAAMRESLWPDASVEDHLKELETILTSRKSGPFPSAILVADDGEQTLAGFLEVGLRSHADGCDTSRPVGFVEGWFTMEALRRQGVGMALMQAAENWARANGCVEMASDTWIDHHDSQCAHEALGFEIVNRCVHFRKAL